MPKSGSPKKGSPKKGSPKSDKGSPKSKKDKDSQPVELTEEEIKKIPITHVIFELDGLLLNSVRAFEQFVNHIIYPYEQYLPLSVIQKIEHRNLEKTVQIIIKELSLPMTQQEMLDEFAKHYSEVLKNIDVMPGVSYLLEYFRRHAMPMAVVTDSTESDYNSKILRHQLLFKKMSHAVCYGSDPERGEFRPKPDIFKLAAERFKDAKPLTHVPGVTSTEPPPPPASSYSVLVFESSWKGVDAALAANMRCVWVPDLRWDVSLHNFNRNLMVIDSLEYFKPQLWGLPYFSDLYTI